MSALEPTAAAPATAPERPLRADARRNREKIVAAARDVFAESGLDALVDDIARRAGVGVGTVYRHFPTKDALVHALVRSKFDVIADEARRRADAPDAWQALCDLLVIGGEAHAADRALAQVWAALPYEAFAVGLRESGLREASAVLLRRAQEDGVVRADVTMDDIPMVMCALSGVTQAHEQGAPGTWRRFLALALDGMRAQGTGTLPP